MRKTEKKKWKKCRQKGFFFAEAEQHLICCQHCMAFGWFGNADTQASRIIILISVRFLFPQSFACPFVCHQFIVCHFTHEEKQIFHWSHEKTIENRKIKQNDLASNVCNMSTNITNDIENELLQEFQMTFISLSKIQDFFTSFHFH